MALPPSGPSLLLRRLKYDPRNEISTLLSPPYNEVETRHTGSLDGLDGLVGLEGLADGLSCLISKLVAIQTANDPKIE